MKEFEKFIWEKFGVSADDFMTILKKNKSADGYFLGAIGELEFTKYAESKGYEVLRIKEKPAGGNNAKIDEARGDFYIRKKFDKTNNWLVVECKSLKSNAEERSIVKKDIIDIEIRKKKILNYLIKYSIKRNEAIQQNLKSNSKKYEYAKSRWKQKHPNRNFPEMQWNKDNPGAGFPDLTKIWSTEDEIKVWMEGLNEKEFSSSDFYEKNSPIKLLQTHMPSTREDKLLNIEATGPLKTDFNILCVDLFLRLGKHKLVFANSKDLNHQATSPNHLQQNYNIDILIKINDKYTDLNIQKPWFEDLDECIKSAKQDYRKIDITQLDNR